ncbi:hypothetical protein HHK36_009052 [Tetracentron sinense]|uniref:DUF4283 domain-containing protein n=1 Tax=Tetracentron sinense TaxID=13715 RepID=A0A834ZCD1_TETSI|nr:hypothetical protein HHK36_009052 [Tetracentron sinense]
MPRIMPLKQISREFQEVRQFTVEAKIVEIQGVELREGFALKITERNKRKMRCSLWVPEEAILWLSKTISEFIDSSGYCFRKFQGRRCSLIGEKRSNERGEFLAFQSFFREGAGGRVFIPKGNRSSGWCALLSALGPGFPSRKPRPVGGYYEGGLQCKKLVTKGWMVKPNKGAVCRIEKPGCPRLVVELDAGDAKNWNLAVVCSIGGPEESDDWEEVSRLISKIIPEDEEISVFPFEERRAIYHAKKASNLALLCRSIPIPVGNRNVVGFRRWWPEANSLSYTCFSKPRWLSVKGIPFHLWISSVLDKVGALCGGLVEIHPSTVEMSDLSFAKIKVKGELNRIPRRISLEFQSIIYPVELSVWEVELCDNCKMWPESMEIRYRRSWVVADGEISGKGGPRVPSGLDAITRDAGQISNFKPMRAEPDLIPAETAGVYGANDKMEEAGELISQKDPIRRLQSAKQAVGFLKGRRQARNRRRRARRQRLRRQRRLGVSVSRSGGVKIASELVQRVRSEKDQACEFGPSSNGPNQLGETLSSVESRLVDTDQRGDEAQPSYDQPTTLGSEDPFGVNPIITRDNTTQTKKNCAVFSKSLGLQSVARDQAVGGPSSIDPLFRQVKSILQRHKADSPGLNSSPCRVSEAVGLDQVASLGNTSGISRREFFAFRFSLDMAKGSRGRRRIAFRKYRPTPYPLSSCHREVSEKDVHQKECSKVAEKKDWEDATCSVCMEFPHHAVLLLCSSHDKGCRSYMCGTSYRYSNCLDQYKKAYTKVTAPNHGQSWHGLTDNSGVGSDSSWPSEKCEVTELACPLCRGQVKGWTVVEPAREYLNSKKRSCMQDDCSFVGTYKELRKHVRAEHPSARPREVDPILEQKWRTLERERERDDVISTVRSSMPGAMVLGDYVIEGNYHGFDTDDDEGDAVDEDGDYEMGFNDNWLDVFFVLQAFGPDGNRRLRRPERGHHHSFDESGGVGIRHTAVAGGAAASGRDDDGHMGPLDLHQGRVMLGRSGRRRRRRGRRIEGI